jgi:UPF0716 protein FxsA
MPLVIAIGFVALVVAEIYVLVAVAHATSVLVAVLLLLVTSVAGGALVRREGAKAWARAAQAVQEGRPPGKDVADGVLILVGGVLLFLPGFITDALGLLLVFPLTRRLFRGLVGFVLVQRIARKLGVRPGRRPRGRRGEGPSVIEGEVVPPRHPDPDA